MSAALQQQAELVADSDPDRAVDLHHEALAVRVEHGLRTFHVDSLDALAALGARGGRADLAVRLLAASDRSREAMGHPRRPLAAPAHEALVAELRTALGDEAFAEAWTAGAGMSLDDAVAYARRTRGARRRPPGGWASLTPTELEVVRPPSKVTRTRRSARACS